jgi:hypothetical protein
MGRMEWREYFQPQADAYVYSDNKRRITAQMLGLDSVFLWY